MKRILQQLQHQRQQQQKEYKKIRQTSQSSQYQSSYSYRGKTWQRAAKKKEVPKSAMAANTSTIVWGSNSKRLGLDASPEKFVTDRTWIKTYVHTAPNNTRFIIKAGSKLVGLDTFDQAKKEEAKQGELQVRRKYS